MAARSEAEIIAQEVSALGGKVAAIEARMSEIDKIIARLEGAALTTAQALQEVSHHWDAVYEAMRREHNSHMDQPVSIRKSP
jgi:prefoldin subunit 5